MVFSGIDSSNSIMTILYWLGLIACVAAGYSKGKPFPRIPLLIFIIINSFGGGWIRDGFVLSTNLWFFSSKAIPDILFVSCIGLIFNLFNEHIKNARAKQINNYIISVIDVLSVGAFIAMGCDKAFAMGFGISTAIISGYITCCWGGMLAYFMNPFANLTSSNIYYNVVVLIGSYIYCHVRNGYLVSIFVSFGMLICNINYEAFVLSNRSEYIDYLSKIYLGYRLQSFQIFFEKTTKRMNNNLLYFKNSFRYIRVYLTFHRIRIF